MSPVSRPGELETRVSRTQSGEMTLQPRGSFLHEHPAPPGLAQLQCSGAQDDCVSFEGCCQQPVDNLPVMAFFRAALALRLHSEHPITHPAPDMERHALTRKTFVTFLKFFWGGY